MNRFPITKIKTSVEHTELCPGKERVRRDRILELQHSRRKAQGVFTISDGIFSALFFLRHKGIVQAIDKELAMVHSINSHRPHGKGRPGSYPGLHILPAMHADLKDAVRFICMRERAHLFGLWDFDLTGNIKSLFTSLLYPVLQDLAYCRIRSRIVVTACLRADTFKSFSEREDYIRSFLPKGIKYIGYDSYCGNFRNRSREFHQRPPMCQFILQGQP